MLEDKVTIGAEVVLQSGVVRLSLLDTYALGAHILYLRADDDHFT